MRFPHRFFILFVVLLMLAGCRNQGKTDINQLVIFHAGSLSVPVKMINEAFQKENPDVLIFSEASGSVAAARKITDLNRNCDILLSADYRVIDQFIIPKYGDWNIKFAANEMVIAYTEKSLFGDKIDSLNWYEILNSPEVKYGRSDPNSDPCGYRSVLCLRLAEKYYGKPGLSDSILQKDQRFIRPKETDLIALLETHNIDYIFIYRSVAVQHQLKYLLLPDSINLKNPGLADWYKTISVEINGKTPGKKIEQYGEPMIYGLTIPKNAGNPELAEKYLRFLLDAAKGMKIMEENGQPSLIPSSTKNWNKIPSSLQQFAIPEK